MELEQLLQLIDAVSESKLTGFCYEENGVKLCLKKEDAAGVPGTAQAAAAAGVLGAAQTVVKTAGAAQTAAGAAGIPETMQTVPAAGQSEGARIISDAESMTAPFDGKIVKSPLVGVFYASPAEGKEPYVSVGDTVKKGQVLACVEAMKLMNEIESEYDGVVAEILVESGQGVGYGEPLFVIR